MACFCLERAVRKGGGGPSAGDAVGGAGNERHSRQSGTGAPAGLPMTTASQPGCSCAPSAETPRWHGQGSSCLLPLPITAQPGQRRRRQTSRPGAGGRRGARSLRLPSRRPPQAAGAAAKGRGCEGPFRSQPRAREGHSLAPGWRARQGPSPGSAFLAGDSPHPTLLGPAERRACVGKQGAQLAGDRSAARPPAAAAGRGSTTPAAFLADDSRRGLAKAPPRAPQARTLARTRPRDRQLPPSLRRLPGRAGRPPALTRRRRRGRWWPG